MRMKLFSNTLTPYGGLAYILSAQLVTRSLREMKKAAWHQPSCCSGLLPGSSCWHNWSTGKRAVLACWKKAHITTWCWGGGHLPIRCWFFSIVKQEKNWILTRCQGPLSIAPLICAVNVLTDGSSEDWEGRWSFWNESSLSCSPEDPIRPQRCWSVCSGGKKKTHKKKHVSPRLIYNLCHTDGVSVSHRIKSEEDKEKYICLLRWLDTCWKLQESFKKFPLQKCEKWFMVLFMS